MSKLKKKQDIGWEKAYRAAQHECACLDRQLKKVKLEVKLLQSDCEQLFTLNEELLDLICNGSVIVNPEIAKKYIAKYEDMTRH